MRLLIRYFRPRVYGNYTTITFDNIDPEKTYVSQLKRKIFIKMKIDPKFQKLSIRGENSQMVELINENSLSMYNVSESTNIVLENLNNLANRDHAFTDHFECKGEHVSSGGASGRPGCDR